MRLDHLTFGQLLKLADTGTLMRVTQAYHKALRRQWNADTESLKKSGMLWEFYPAGHSFSVAEAEEAYPVTARPWRKVLEFLRSSELKSAVKESARRTEIPPSCYVSIYRSLSNRLFPNERSRHALAALIATHARIHGVVATVWEKENSYDVVVATDSMGCQLLANKPGLKWSTIELMCYEMNVNVDRVFWWLSEYRDKTGWRVNPAVWPVNTPDVSEHALELVDTGGMRN